MLNVTYDWAEGGPRRVLAVGAHCDDIEIGCGGTMLRLADTHPGLEVCWIVLSAQAERGREARASAGAFLAGVERPTVMLEQFRDGFFPSLSRDIKEFFETVKARFAPDLVFTHYRHDLHQDHRLIAELTWNTFRNHLVLEYEVPKYDGDLGSPNFFVELSEETCRRKAALLIASFPSQRDRHWFTEDVFLSLSRLRGMEAHSSTRFAEAFYGRKVVM